MKTIPAKKNAGSYYIWYYVETSDARSYDSSVPARLADPVVIAPKPVTVSGITASDNVSQITHIIGGLSGAALGMIFKK